MSVFKASAGTSKFPSALVYYISLSSFTSTLVLFLIVSLFPFSDQQQSISPRKKKEKKTMCYANLGTLICQACGRRVGEQPVGTTPCLAGCGKYVSRVTGAVVRGECGVCSQAKEQRSQLTMRLNRAFGK